MPQNMWVQASIPSEVNIVTSYGGKRLCDLGIGTHAVDMAQASLHSLTMPSMLPALHSCCALPWPGPDFCVFPVLSPC